MSTAPAPSASRRAFLRGGRAVEAIRPPGALPGPDFLATCTRCDACVDACPEGIVVRGDGGFPVLDFGRGECTFCGDCATACKPAALLPALAADWPWRAAIDTGCLARAGVVCQACRDACPASAIRFPMRIGVAEPVLELAACTGCGACVGACPTSAIRMHQPTPAEALA